MLILTRKPSQVIRINDDIAITVLGVQGLQVRFGVDAPAGVSVHRQEVYERISAERAQSVEAEQVNQIGQEDEDVNRTAEESSVVAFNVDDHVRMARDAARYQWLRDKSRIDDMDTDLCAAREEQCYFGTELDTEIDNGMRLARLLEANGEPV